MPELYERILGVHATLPKIPVHSFQAAAGEWAAGTITGAEAQAIVTAVSGAALGATGVTEAQDLVATVTNIAVPAAPAALGASPTVAQIATHVNAMDANLSGRVEREKQVTKIDRVLLLADQGAPGYDTPAALRAKLNVPLR